MASKKFFSVMSIVVLTFGLGLTGCTTFIQNPGLSRSVLNQLPNGDASATELQYYLSSPLTLRSLEPYKSGEIKGGNPYTYPTEIQIGNITPGIALGAPTANEEGLLTVRVSFDAKNPNNYLTFVQRADYDLSAFVVMWDDDKKTVTYGGKEYSILQKQLVARGAYGSSTYLYTEVIDKDDLPVLVMHYPQAKPQSTVLTGNKLK